MCSTWRAPDQAQNRLDLQRAVRARNENNNNTRPLHTIPPAGPPLLLVPQQGCVAGSEAPAHTLTPSTLFCLRCWSTNIISACRPTLHPELYLYLHLYYLYQVEVKVLHLYLHLYYLYQVEVKVLYLYLHLYYLYQVEVKLLHLYLHLYYLYQVEVQVLHLCLCTC